MIIIGWKMNEEEFYKRVLSVGETHPSLKFKEVVISFSIESFDNVEWRTNENVSRSLIRSEDVQKYTIDKQIVQEAFDLILKDIDDDLEQGSSLQYNVHKVFNNHIKNIIKKRFGDLQ